MSWDHAQPAPLALWKLVHANFPQTRNLGIYNARNIAGTNTPSLHAEGRALADRNILAVIVNRDRRLMSVLYRPDDVFRTPRGVTAEEDAGAGARHRVA